MRLLVTGGAGFIGSCFIRHMLSKYPDYRIINLDNLTYAGNLENLKDIEHNPNYSFIHGDICDENLLAEIMRQTDCCLNFAAKHMLTEVSQDRMFLFIQMYWEPRICCIWQKNTN